MLSEELNLLQEFKGHKLPVTCGCSNGVYVASGSWDYSTKLFDISTGEQTNTFHIDRNMSTSM